MLFYGDRYYRLHATEGIVIALMLLSAKSILSLMWDGLYSSVRQAPNELRTYENEQDYSCNSCYLSVGIFVVFVT